MERHILFTATARRRLYQIEQYHTGRGNPKKGKRTVQKLIKQIKKLVKHPELGVLTAQLSDTDEYRVLVAISDYKVIYSIAEESVVIEEVFDVRQDPNRLKLG